MRKRYPPTLYGAVLLSLFLTACAQFTPLLGIGNTTEFEVRGDRLLMSGIINNNTPEQLVELLTDNPNLREIVLMDVPGSIDDEANIRASRLVRKAGLNTRLLVDSHVASGGVDFFISGQKRIIANGAKIGVHSWSSSDGEGRNIAKRDPQHQLYLKYYREMGVPDSFYWFTLNAASADDIYYMTKEEIKKYKIAQ